MKPIVFPYKMGSQSAKLIARALGAKRVYPDRNYRPRSNHVIINWGSSTYPNWLGIRPYPEKILNYLEGVRLAGNKLTTFELLRSNNVAIPEFTTDISVAREWDGIVVCRQTLTGSQGAGIVIAETPDQIIQAPLYTKHLRHKHEYRVHVMNGQVIDFTQKKKRSSLEEVSQYVRNSSGGWVFCRSGVELPDDVVLQAINAVSSLGLDFGAVDVAYRERENKAFVLEVNTAPGMDEEGTTLQRYVDGFKELIGDLNV